jgi:hypothetical protein
MALRRFALSAVGVAAVVLVAGVAVDRALDDPTTTVSAVELGQSVVDPGQGGGTRSAVPALDQVRGTFDRGDDPDDFQVGRVELDFGPDLWVTHAPAIADFDGDGREEALLDELDGLVGRQVDLRVRLDDDGDDAAVYVIDGRTYREIGGPAPWQSADAASEDEVRAAAAEAVGPGARVVDLDAEDGATVAWEAEVVDADGREHDVLLDSSGKVLDVRAD